MSWDRILCILGFIYVGLVCHFPPKMELSDGIVYVYGSFASFMIRCVMKVAKQDVSDNSAESSIKNE